MAWRAWRGGRRRPCNGKSEDGHGEASSFSCLQELKSGGYTARCMLHALQQRGELARWQLGFASGTRHGDLILRWLAAKGRSQASEPLRLSCRIAVGDRADIEALGAVQQRRRHSWANVNRCCLRLDKARRRRSC